MDMQVYLKTSKVWLLLICRALQWPRPSLISCLVQINKLEDREDILVSDSLLPGTLL